MSGQTANSYLKMLTLVFLAISLLIIAFNFISNPFKIYPDLNGFGPQRNADLFWYARLHKPYRVASLKPSHLIAGSSRAARLPPELLAGKGYNLALPGATLFEVRRNIEHAHAHQDLQQIVIMLDFEMFRAQSKTNLIGDDNRLRRIKPNTAEQLNYYLAMAEDHWRSLYSRGAIASSWKLITNQSNTQREFFADGTWRSKLAKRNMRDWMLRSKVREYAAYTHKDALDYSQFRQLLAFLQQQRIQTYLLIAPNHAGILHSMKFAGAWSNYLQWHQQLLAELKKYPSNNTSVTLFGLEHQAAWVMQAPKQQPAYFRDGLHMTPFAGRALMRCLAASPECEPKNRPQRLADNTIGQYLSQLEQNTRDYAVQQKEDSKRLRMMFNESYRKTSTSAPSAPK